MFAKGKPAYVILSTPVNSLSWKSFLANVEKDTIMQIRKPSRAQSNLAEESDVDLTPMLDVIFIMLIFFIVTASFVKESGLAINSPPASKEKSSHSPIVLEVLQAGRITIEDSPVDARAIKPMITRLIAEQPDASVAVRVHKSAKTQHVVQALDALKAAKVNQPPVSLIEI